MKTKWIEITRNEVATRHIQAKGQDKNDQRPPLAMLCHTVPMFFLSNEDREEKDLIACLQRQKASLL